MAYHQVPVAPFYIEKTAFITHAGLYEILKMPFGLCNAPPTYQRLMSIVLRGLIALICLAYLDDVIVYSRRLPQHLDDLRAVFERLRVAGLKLKPSSCTPTKSSTWVTLSTSPASPPTPQNFAY